MPKIHVFEAEFDKESGYYNTKILMDMVYCSLSTYSKAVKKCGLKFDEKKLLDLLSKLSFALKQLQKKGIAHRDIKPENILIDEKFEKILLINIGVAEYSNANSDSQKENMIIGSPLYMSPELF